MREGQGEVRVNPTSVSHTSTCSEFALALGQLGRAAEEGGLAGGSGVPLNLRFRALKGYWYVGAVTLIPRLCYAYERFKIKSQCRLSHPC